MNNNKVLLRVEQQKQQEEQQSENMERMLILCIKQIWGYISYLQSLWLTSWFGYNNNKGYSNRNSNRSHIASAVDAAVYTLQQPHKFPLQLDVYSGNCSFDYQQHELPSGHYRNQQQPQQQQQHQQPQQQRGEHKLQSAASTAQAQSTLSVEQLKLKLTKASSGGVWEQGKQRQQPFLRNSSEIYETKFIESSAEQKMDDMVYQCSNQNSIYVLNAGYNPSYGDFGTHAMHTQMAATGREMNGSRTTRTRNSIGASCSSAACSLQHKFKSFGTATAAVSNGNSSAMPSSAATASATATATAIATTAATMATTIIAATATPTAPASAAAAAAATTSTATTTTTLTTTNYVNPVATSMSTAMCSPATAALQKLFNCSVGVGVGVSVGGGNVCQNVSHRNHQQQQQHRQQQQQQQSNNNCPVGSHNNSCLSATSSSHRSICDPHEGPAGAAAVGAALPLLGSTSMANKKKCTNVKSTLIAKKTKFLKFLEEEKWRSSNNIQSAQLTAQDAESCGAPLALLPSSNEAEPYTASTTSAMAATSSLAAQSGIKHNNNNSREEATEADQQQNNVNNWSMYNDSNNKLTKYQQQQQEQQQQQLEMNKQTAKTSYELYQEAADILGLSCSLCDNCRCLDCQSGYFDCADDDDESYSEQSLMDEYDEYDYQGFYGYEQQASLLTSAHHAGPNQPAMTQPDQHQLHHQQELQQQAPDLNLCYAVDCQQNCIRSDDGQPKEGTFQTESEYGNENETQTETETEPNTATKSEHRLAIDFDLINATSSQVLQNCATFNDLSLLDVERQVEPFT